MKPEEFPMMGEKLLGGSGTSILRAAATEILASLEKAEAIEGEEDKLITAIRDVAKRAGMERSLVAAMIVHGIAQSYIAQKTRGAVPDTSQYQKVGNC